MSLHLHRAERADRLVDALADVLAEPLADPFATEVVGVPTRGVERWLAQRLSSRLGSSTNGRGDGICAGVAFPSLRRLISGAVGFGDSRQHQADPWEPDHAVWPLLEVIDHSRGEAWAALLWHFLAGPADPGAEGAGDEATRGAAPGRRWRTARQLAELFARYATSRPTMIDHWGAGRDLDADGRPLSPDLAWQAELWRRLRNRLDEPDPPARLNGALRRLEQDPGAIDLPPRVSVFGATRLDHDQVRVLTALAQHRDVHLWLPHASPALWDTVTDELARQPLAIGLRSSDRTATLIRHRLLGYLGRDSRELQIMLAATGPIGADRHYPAPASEPAEAPHLLARLQADLTANIDPSAGPERRPLDPEDGSVQIHASHGPDRQVEVLREVLVGLLADDPTLEPRDIVVMCPDIERFAPLISAAFGLDTDDARAEHPGHRLRVRLADRSLRQLNPLLAVLGRVLDLADSRVTVASLLDLAAYPPVARKFAFSDDDLDRLNQLVVDSGVRWGLDGPHRRPYGMADFRQNTWAAGLDRLLLGVAMDEDGDHFIGTALPLDDVDSSDVDLVGRLAELVGRVRQFVDATAGRQTLPDWITLARNVIDGLTSTTPSESWQVSHSYAQLARLGAAAGGSADVQLGLAEWRALLGDSFRGRASRANFRTGTLTIATLYPMRSVPHRVVCLLGVDDGVFPRRMRPLGDDIVATQQWIGDRDPRSEDRQLLLDAVMAAEDQLIVIYGGFDPRTRAVRPPAVPIGELLDALDHTVPSGDDRPVRDHLTRHHPLQPFDPKNFTRGSRPGVSARPFSFDHAGLLGAEAAAQSRREVSAAYGLGPLSPPDIGDVLDLTDLVRFFGHPPRALLRNRGVPATTWVEDDDEAADQLPVELNGLEIWQIGERMLERRLRGADLAQIEAAEWRRGTLPPLAFGGQTLQRVRSGVNEVSELARPFLAGTPGSADVRVLAGTRLVAGTLQPLYEDALVRVSYSRLTARHRLASWIQLLALSAARPDRRWRAVTVGRGNRSLLGPVDPDWAGRVLADLVELYLTGVGEPLPLAPQTSAEYARLREQDRSVAVYLDKLEIVWKRERDAVWERFLGTDATLSSSLLSVASRPAEERGTLVEPSRFGTIARRVFSPLLRNEELT